ncbi:MAG: hypothetical protein OXI67_06835 [Candidatus Poribacteria bacterium]|nr:hypothetical protein [Candidatus Poribacteria bacterium]
MNCEQTRENLVLHRENPILKGTERREFLQHLRSCKACQVEYEGLWHTATVLGNLEAPEPPPELLGNIQRQIRETHKRSQTAFFAAPISWLFGKMKLKFSSQVVNYAAMLCYLIASVFLVKLAFFSDAPKQTDKPEQNFGFTAMEETRLQYVRIAPSPWASLKDKNTKTDERHSAQISSENRVDFSNQFVDIKTSELWHTHAINNVAETVDTHLVSTVSEKLTLFWSDIKTNL